MTHRANLARQLASYLAAHPETTGLALEGLCLMAIAHATPDQMTGLAIALDGAEDTMGQALHASLSQFANELETHAPDWKGKG